MTVAPDLPRAAAATAPRMVQLVVSTAVLGTGVSLLLGADLGADGFAMLIDGVAEASGLEFVIANTVISILFIVMAWVRGVVPGAGTVVLPVVVGGVVSLLENVVPQPDRIGWQVVEFVIAFGVICVGVASYLASDLGAGPTEAAAIAWDPPIPFRWSYNGVQLVSALVGWALGATLGVGSVIVVALIGPVVARLIPILTLPGPNSA